MTVTVPTSLGAALEALAATPATQVLAGGTDFMVEVNDGRRRPPAVVCTAAIPELRGWDVEGDEIRIGAGVTYRELLEPPLADLIPALAQAARTVGSPPIRNAGTIGGNVATASPAGDTLPVLAALDARIELASTRGSRRVAVSELIVGPKRTTMRPGELITAVHVRQNGGGQEYLKVGVRNAMVIAVASLAMVVDPPNGRIGIGLGSVGPVPLRAAEAEAWLASRVDWPTMRLIGRDGSDQAETLDRLAALVGAAARPIDDHRSTARYRTHAVGVLAGRAARRLFGVAVGRGPA
jgi:CO/xanthine dehydrogenase FAD-binding subunit